MRYGLQVLTENKFISKSLGPWCPRATVCHSPLPGVGRENPLTWWYEFKGPPEGANRRKPRRSQISTLPSDHDGLTFLLLKVRHLFYYSRNPCIHDNIMIHYDLFYANWCSPYPSTDANGTSSGEYVGLSSSYEVTVASVDMG
jgi:hypothetical protein